MHAAYGQRLAKPAVARRRDVEWHSGCSQRLEAAREYGCAIATAPIPILASCHKEDVQMIDRMILKRVELLPHASFQQVERDIGLEGEKLIAYV